MAWFPCNLNSNLGGKVYYLGTGTSFDIKSIFPDDYMKFTVDNFIVCQNKLSLSAKSSMVARHPEFNRGDSASNTGTISPSYSYNASTGILSVTVNSGSISTYAYTGPDSYFSSTSSSCTITANAPQVYLVTGEIENV